MVLLGPNRALLGEADKATQHYSDKLLHHAAAAAAARSKVQANCYGVPKRGVEARVTCASQQSSP